MIINHIAVITVIWADHGVKPGSDLPAAIGENDVGIFVYHCPMQAPVARSGGHRRLKPGHIMDINLLTIGFYHRFGSRYGRGCVGRVGSNGLR